MFRARSVLSTRKKTFTGHKVTQDVLVKVYTILNGNSWVWNERSNVEMKVYIAPEPSRGLPLFVNHNIVLHTT